jgi:hypothetical protein
MMRYGLLICLLGSTMFAQSAYKAPRTPWGVPDLGGYYLNKQSAPLERPQNLGAKEFYTETELAEREAAAAARPPAPPKVQGTAEDAHYDFEQFGLDTATSGSVRSLRTSQIVGPVGRIPPTIPAAAKRIADAAAARRGHEFDGVEYRSLGERCIMYASEGPPLLSGGYNPNLQIFQGPNQVIIRVEMMGGARIIRTDGSPHPDASVRQWYGDSIGHWEGDTLVADTTNFTDQPPLGRGTTRNLHVVERFTPISKDLIKYEFTVSDPSTWEQSWSAEYNIQKIEGPIFEYACAEGNYGLPNILSGARAAEREAAANK